MTASSLPSSSWGYDKRIGTCTGDVSLVITQPHLLHPLLTAKPLPLQLLILFWLNFPISPGACNACYIPAIQQYQLWAVCIYFCLGGLANPLVPAELRRLWTRAWQTDTELQNGAAEVRGTTSVTLVLLRPPLKGTWIPDEHADLIIQSLKAILLNALIVWHLVCCMVMKGNRWDFLGPSFPVS